MALKKETYSVPRIELEKIMAELWEANNLLNYDTKPSMNKTIANEKINTVLKKIESVILN